MATNWMRRTLASAGICACAVWLAACGSSSTANSISPDRIITFGDAMSDVGQNPGGRPFSVSNGSVDNWTQEVAWRYNLPLLTPAKQGGSAYAQGNARVRLPDASGVTNAPSVAEQIDSYLQANPSFGSRTFVLMSGGQSDVIAGMNEVLAGTKTTDEYLSDIQTAGLQMADLVHRLHNAGAPRVLVIGTQNLRHTLWAKALDAAHPSIGADKPSVWLQVASYAFNDALLGAMVDLQGTEVLYADVAYYFNSMTGSPGGYGFSKSTEPVCTTVDPQNAMNIGTDQINSSLCTMNTLIAGADVNQYLFADLISYTPAAHLRFGDSVYNRMRANW